MARPDNQVPATDSDITLHPAQAAGWYRAVSGTLSSGRPQRFASGPIAVAEREKAIRLPLAAMAETGPVLKAQDSYNLICMLAERSQTVRTELAGQLVDHLLAEGPTQRARYRRLGQAKLTASISELTGNQSEDAMDALYGDDWNTPRNWYQPNFPTATAHALQQTCWAGQRARQDYLPAPTNHASEDWHVHVRRNAFDRLNTDLAVAEMLVGLEHDLNTVGQDTARSNAVASLSARLDGDAMVRTVDDLHAHYGTPDDPYDGVDPARAHLQIDAVSIALKHWNSIDPDGSFPGGITVARGRHRLIPAATVDTLARAHAPAADAEAPKPSAEILPFRRPGHTHP